jgi:uncharacterized membrane protein
MKKFYAGIVLAGMMAAALAVTGCSSPTGEHRVYSIELEPTGTYDFPEAGIGYGAQTAKTVTVTNTGNQATGTLTIGKSGANPGSFTVSKTSLNDIAAEGIDSFTVVPTTGLALGTYTAVITVNGGNDLNASLNVRFTVTETPAYAIGLSETGTYVFPAVTTGYGSQTARPITVTNTGSQATGTLTIGKSGVNAYEFTVSTTSLNSIAVNGNNNFTVAPATGLAEGTYTATITVTGENDLSAGFAVSFTVSNSPIYSIVLSQSGPYDFPGAEAGYGPQSAITVNVTNTGNQATGPLTIGNSGASFFSVSPGSLSSIAAGGTGTFTVAPNMGLGSGGYTGTITVNGGNIPSVGFNVSFTVTAPPPFGIRLNQTGTYTFPGAAPGYGPQDEKTVTVTNTGTQTTGDLTITKSGTNADDFEVLPDNLGSIAAGGTANFTVVPNPGLALGTYTATITVSGGNNISANFNVSFIVSTAPAYSIGLSETGTYAFPRADPDYGPQNPRTVTINNTGTSATGTLTIGKSGANANSFTVSKATINNIATGGNDSFTVAPNTGLAEGTYTATITVSGGNAISAGFDVSFRVAVTQPYDIELSETGTYDFPDIVVGDPDPSTITVTVSNTGTQPTGPLTIAKSGTNAGSFTVTPYILPSIAAGGNSPFVVFVPGALTAGTYTATITVSGGNGITASFNVSLTVTPAPVDPVYDIRLSETAYTFPGAIYGYGAQGAKTVTVSNTGNQDTGTLTIETSGSNPGSFTVSKTSINTIAAEGTDSFTVVPNTGLAVGTYTATITVSGENAITASFNVSFTVTSAPVIPGYGVELSETGTYTFTEAAPGYGAQSSRTITVTNTGNQATGTLTIGKSGAGAGSFTVSKTSINTIAVDGADSFTVVPNTGLALGTYTATITVSGGNGIYAAFDVSFTVSPPLSSNAYLGDLSVNTGWLDQQFSSNTTAYTMTVPYTTTSVTVSAAVMDTGKATLEYLPSATVSLNPGSNTVRVRVTAEDGTTTRVYTITVTRTPKSANANLGSLSVSAGTLSPAFSANTTGYTVLVSDSVPSFTVTAAVADTGKATLSVTSPYTVTLNAAPNPTVITLTVTAENGTTTKTYTVTVNKTTETNAVDVAISIADEHIDLTRNTANDLSQEAGNTIRLTAPEGYTNYTWSVDMSFYNYSTISERVIELYSGSSYGLGTHSVLLRYEKDGIPYGCEVLFRVVR